MEIVADRELLERYGIAPVEAGGTDSTEASRGGRVARVCLQREAGNETLELKLGNAAVKANAPHNVAEALEILRRLREKNAFPADPSFTLMLGHLLMRATKLFEEVAAERFELSQVRLHPTSYHIGKAILSVTKPIHVNARLDPHSHDRRAVFDHRHGDSIENPK